MAAFGNKQQKSENKNLGFIKSLHMQHCCMRGCIRPLAEMINENTRAYFQPILAHRAGHYEHG